MRRVLLALLRVLVGGVFVATGVAKLQRHAAEARLFAHWGLPSPSTAVYVVAVVELVFGLLLLVGLAPRLAALVLGVNMLGALATAGRVDHGVHLIAPPVLALCCLVLVARGGGRWQLLDVVDPATPPVPDVILRLELEYDGTAFRGWARQPGLRTVEGVLGAALDRAYPGWEGLVVAGRTDTGVHALRQVASVEVSGGAPPSAAPLAINAFLPHDVSVRAAAAAPAGFHARHSARARAYVYRVRTGRIRPALEARRVLHHPRALDRAVLDEWAAAVVGTHDFMAFTPTETQHDGFVRTVAHAGWEWDGDEGRLVVAADRFLRHMVRTLVGTMLQAARGEPLPPPSRLLAGADRAEAGVTAPPWGLYLAGVRFEGEPPGIELAATRGLLPT